MKPRDAAGQVLLVDDHPTVRAGVSLVLKHRVPGVQVWEAGCAKEALKELEVRPMQLALVDVNLPGRSGLELIRLIRARDRRIRVLMFAAEADPWTVREALRAGAAGFVAKSLSADALSAAVRVVLAGGRYLCPESRAALDRANRCGQEPSDRPGPAILSAREREVLRSLARGENTKSIAGLLEISPKTVETHRQHIGRKLGTNNPAALVRYAIRHGLVGA